MNKNVNRKRSRLLGALSGRRREQELSDEIASHIEMQTEDNIRAGMPLEEARRQAKLKFGTLDSAKESYRDQRGLPWLETTLADLSYAARSLKNSPAFTLVAVLTLAIGIGANTSIFSLVNQLLLHPPGIDRPERVVGLRTEYQKLNLAFNGSSSANLPDLRASANVFEHAAIAGRGDLNYTDGPSPERLRGSAISAEWFDIFGAKPLLGRVFSPQEDQPKLNRVAVLSYGAWIKIFGGDPKVIGRMVQLNQTPHQVVGVMRADFEQPRNTDIWTPIGLDLKSYQPSNRFNESFILAARLKPGVLFEQGQAWMRVLTDRVYKSETSSAAIAKSSNWSISLVHYTDDAAGDNKAAVLLLLAAVGFVLLIACSNIAGLMVARTSARARELAVRAALGAGRVRLVRQILSESLLLGAAGGVSGLALAFGAVRLLLRLAPESVVAGVNASLDIYVMLFCAGATFAAALLFGVTPAWQVSRVDLQGSLKIEGRSNTVDSARQRFRSLLVIAETALALTLLVAAGLFIRSFVRLQTINPGFNPKGVMTAMYLLPAAQYGGGRDQANFHRALLANLRSAPGVVSVGLGYPTPFSGDNEAGSFQIEGHPAGPNDPGQHGDRGFISPGYMEALSISLKAGRYFTDQDRVGSELVAIIDDSLARQYWPNEEPLGKRIKLGDGAPWMTIVGIVGHVMHSSLASDSGKGVVYLSLFQRSIPGASIVVKTSGDPNLMTAVIREAVHAADPHQAVHTFGTMDYWVSRSLDTRRFGMRLLGFFGITALFLAALGLYGVISYSVTQRTREIGIRMALGAERRSVVSLVVGQGLRLSILGVVIGIGCAALMGEYLQSLRFQVQSFDPLTIGATAAALIFAGLLASYLPARRAVRVDPAITLRSD
jgi:predicted permease